MNVETDDKLKIEQFNEFFSIAHDFSINLNAIEHASEHDFEQFITNMPLPFKIASEVATLDQSAVRSIQGLSGVASHLVEFLNHQNQKINLLVNYILSQQDEEESRFKGIEFGGGGVTLAADKAFELHQMLEMKIFLLQENCAVFCHGEVIAVEQKNDSFIHKIIFHHIRDEDRETLVRTSLHEQSKQLQALSQQRSQNN